MNFYLRRLLAVALSLSASALAQPRVLQGDAVSNYSGARNFVVNPSAQMNTASTAVSNATVTRSTTTPLSEIGTEYTVTITSANGTIDFLTSGITNDNLGAVWCEASVKVRGFQATSKLQVFDGTNVLGEVLIGAQVTPRIVSVPFQCPPTGSANLRPRITDTATLSGTHEVAEAYLGKARNVGDAENTTAWASYTPTVQNAGSKGWTNSTARFRRVGDSLQIEATLDSNAVASGAGAGTFTFSIPAGLTIATGKLSTGLNNPVQINGTAQFINSSGIIQAQSGVVPITTTTLGFAEAGQTGVWTTGDFNAGGAFYISVNATLPIENWPTASSAVTPANQNVFGSVQWRSGVDAPLVSTQTAKTVLSGVLGTPTFTGSAVAGSTCGLGASDVGVCFQNIPAGTYQIIASGPFFNTQANPAPNCYFDIFNSTFGIISSTQLAGNTSLETYMGSFSGTITLQSALSQFPISIRASNASASGTCRMRFSATSNQETTPGIQLVRLESRNSQPVFIQSPIRAAQTGVSPIAGEVGHRLLVTRTSVFSQGSPTVGTWYDITSMSLTLDPGVWDLETQCSVGTDFSSGSGYAMPSISIRTGSTTLASGIGGFAGDPANATNPPRFWYGSPRASTRIGISSPVTYKTSIAVLGFSGAPIFTSVDARGDLGGGNECYLEAVRVPDR